MGSQYGSVKSLQVRWLKGACMRYADIVGLTEQHHMCMVLKQSMEGLP